MSKSKLTQAYEKELEEAYANKLNSPLWLAEASKNIGKLKGYIELVDEYGVQTMRYNLAINDIEQTPKEVELEYQLAKQTLKLLEEDEDV